MRGNRYEILLGELTPLPSAGHQGVAARPLVTLAIWCRAHTGWRFLTPGSVYISKTTWLGPDIAIYPSPEYLNLPWRDMPAPVLVVEVLSPFTRKRDRNRKRPAYLAHGVGEVWIDVCRQRHSVESRRQFQQNIRGATASRAFPSVETLECRESLPPASGSLR